MTPQEVLEILHVAERLKCNTRHCDTSTGRRESVAEHSWREALGLEPVGLHRLRLLPPHLCPRRPGHGGPHRYSHRPYEVRWLRALHRRLSYGRHRAAV